MFIILCLIGLLVSYVLEATFSDGYLSLIVDCLSDDGEPVLFLLVPLVGPLSASFNLFEAVCRIHQSLTAHLTSWNRGSSSWSVKSCVIIHYRWLILATRALSLTFMITQ